MVKVEQARLAAGPLTGHLRIVLTVNLTPGQELALGERYGCHDAAAANLKLKPRERDIGPIVSRAVGAMLNALDTDLEYGARWLRKRKGEKAPEKAKKERKPSTTKLERRVLAAVPEYPDRAVAEWIGLEVGGMTKKEALKALQGLRAKGLVTRDGSWAWFQQAVKP